MSRAIRENNKGSCRERSSAAHSLPSLPTACNPLEPYIDAAEKQIGSDRVWPVKPLPEGGNLQVRNPTGQGSPLVNRALQILPNDTGEHASYLKYEHRRGDSLRARWNGLNPKEAARRSDRSPEQAAEDDWEDEGGAVQGDTT